MVDAGRCRAQWASRPLSRCYGLAVIDVAIVRLRDAQGLHELRIRWAFGWLADGECEALGVWADAAEPRQLLAEFRARGVERIWHLVDAASCTGMIQIRARVSKSEQLEAEQVRAGLARAIRRHGSFASEPEALDFVADALQRAERRLDRDRLGTKGRARLDPGMQTAPLGL
jgi:hypothetical protein